MKSRNEIILTILPEEKAETGPARDEVAKDETYGMDVD